MLYRYQLLHFTLKIRIYTRNLKEWNAEIAKINLAKKPVPSEALAQLELYPIQFLFWVSLCVKSLAGILIKFVLRFPICLKKINTPLSSAQWGQCHNQHPWEVLTIWIRVMWEWKSLLYCSLLQYSRSHLVMTKWTNFNVALLTHDKIWPNGSTPSLSTSSPTCSDLAGAKFVLNY